MKAINRFFIALFCFVSAGVCGVASVVLNSTFWEESFIPADMEKKISWFGAHPDETRTVVVVLWVVVGLFAVFGIFSLIKIATDKRTTADSELDIEFKRLDE